MVTFLNNLELIGAGENVQAGIAQGMTEAGWDTDAASVVTNLQTALDTAMGTGMEETGEQTAAGIRNGRTDIIAYEDTGICMQRLNKQVIAPDIWPRVLE